MHSVCVPTISIPQVNHDRTSYLLAIIIPLLNLKPNKEVWTESGPCWLQLEHNQIVASRVRPPMQSRGWHRLGNRSPPRFTRKSLFSGWLLCCQSTLQHIVSLRTKESSLYPPSVEPILHRLTAREESRYGLEESSGRITRRRHDDRTVDLKTEKTGSGGTVGPKSRLPPMLFFFGLCRFSIRSRDHFNDNTKIQIYQLRLNIERERRRKQD